MREMQELPNNVEHLRVLFQKVMENQKTLNAAVLIFAPDLEDYITKPNKHSK